MNNKIRYLIAISILLLSFTLLAWSYLPVQRRVDVQNLTPSEMVIQSNPQAADSALLETRRIRLEWPESMRIGDDYNIDLIFEQLMDSNTLQPPAAAFSNVYECCNVMAEARFEVAGINVDPANPTRESMLPGQPVK